MPLGVLVDDVHGTQRLGQDESLSAFRETRSIM